MLFFLDENFPKTVARILSERGDTVFDIRSSELEGSDDIDIFKFAIAKQAIFLTTDKDFFHTIPMLFKEHHGVIVIALRQLNRKSITEKLLFALNHFDLSRFKSTVLLLKDNSYSIYNKEP